MQINAEFRHRALPAMTLARHLQSAVPQRYR
jgi:hypothetical protein